MLIQLYYLDLYSATAVKSRLVVSYMRYIYTYAKLLSDASLQIFRIVNNPEASIIARNLARVIRGVKEI